MENQGEIVLYQLDKEVKLEVRLENETVWLSIDEISKLFGRDISVIGKHIRNIFKEGELVKDSVWAKFAYTASKSIPVLTGKLLQMIPHEIVVAKIESITNKAKGVMPMQGI